LDENLRYLLLNPAVSIQERAGCATPLLKFTLIILQVWLRGTPC